MVWKKRAAQMGRSVSKTCDVRWDMVKEGVQCLGTPGRRVVVYFCTDERKRRRFDCVKGAEMMI